MDARSRPAPNKTRQRVLEERRLDRRNLIAVLAVIDFANEVARDQWRRHLLTGESAANWPWRQNGGKTTA